MAFMHVVVALAVLLVAIASGREVAVNQKLRAEMYANGLVHERIMATKHVSESEPDSAWTRH
jgi:hypothetical protein